MTNFKRVAIVYASICILLAVFVSPFFGINELSRSYASSAKKEQSTTRSLKKTFSKDTIINLTGSYSSVVSVAVEPYTAIVFIGLFENVDKITGNHLKIAHTPASNIFIIILAFLFGAATKIVKSFNAIKMFGLVTLGKLEKVLGFGFILLLGISNIIGFSDYCITNNVSAAAGVSTGNSAFFVGLLSALFSGFMAVVSLTVYYIVKTVFFGIDTLQSFFSFVPFSGFVFELFKTVLVIVTLVFHVVFPKVGMVLDVLIFIGACVLFQYMVHFGEFIRILYLRPLCLRLRVMNDEIPLVYAKTPKYIKEYCESEGIKYDLCIPGYCFKKKEADGYKMKFMDNVWIVNTEEGPILLKKKFRKIQRYNFYGKEKKYFLKKEWRFIELFSNPVGDKIYKKDMRAIIPIEYSKRFDEICEKLSFENYKTYKSKEKLTKKELRIQKREERKEKIKTKIDALTDKIASAIQYVLGILRKLNPFRKDKNSNNAE